jgi:mannose-6-phosphate isomerase/beta-glucosidase
MIEKLTEAAMREIVFLKPVFKEMIWGGNRLKTDFLYDIPGDNTGECWAVSAHKNGDCQIATGSFAGSTLSQLWESHRHIFGNVDGDVFPLLIKIIDAKADLSIQVHPDDEYAKVNENGSLGKTECWYILDCDVDAKIVIGHHAKSKRELAEMIHENEWDNLIRIIPIKKGDFFQIEPGTVHAIKAGTLILETQQNSDITYRLYDYGRLQDGKPRELHIDKSIDVIECPHNDIAATHQLTKLESASVDQLITCEYYSVNLIDVIDAQKFIQDKPFIIMSVIEGEGMIDGTKITKGDHFILPYEYGEYELSGKMRLVSSTI